MRRTISYAAVIGTMLCAVVPAHGEWLLREAAIMGTRCAVEFWIDDIARGEALAAAAFAEMRRVDALMSTNKPDSEVSRLNARGSRQPVRLSAELYGLIEESVEFSRLSGGAFDITYASVGYLYDYRARRRPDTALVDRALRAVDYRQLQLQPARRSVRFLRPGMRIDLGGIAKGYAVDRAMALLRAAGIERAMVNAGGDSLIAGDRFGRPWIVGIRDPNDAGKVVLRLPLTDTAISTSGDYERFFEEGGIRYHHIIDPRTGDSARRLRSATVLAPTATRSDALSTTVFVLGADAGLELIERLPGVDAVVVTPEGQVRYSSGLAPP
ncbi:MAG: FAD:protein FMN transferase [Steroidobacteraceae bacterium]|nr:FAD:protein FMN transferase [Steroidobacteraceae bacterium]MDW8257845.1 FAD:protein FMN transferase [Gammaproteobacteria bacterium]